MSKIPDSSEKTERLDHLLVQNKNLKDQLLLLCKRVEESLQPKNRVNESVTEEISLDYMPIHQSINRYKEETTKIKAKMEGVYNLRKIEALENEIKHKRDKLINLKHENTVLTNIQKNQNKAKLLFEQKYENKSEVKFFQDKIKSLKEEYKYSKDLQKSTEAKLKSQMTTIVNLEEKCDIIKQNIEFKKRSSTGNLEDQSLNSLEEKVKFVELQLNNEEKNYKNEISRQQLSINKLNEELSMINIQLKEKEQEIRINELKIKELKKINRMNKEIGQKNIRGKSNDYRPISVKTHETNPRSLSKPVSKTPNNFRNKPFNIKFETNYSNNNKVPSNMEKGSAEEMLFQIENLKNELKNALKYNEEIFTKGLEQENMVNENQILNHSYKLNSSLISNKDLFEKIDNSIVKEGKENRKPFKPFNFEQKNN